MTTQPPEHPRRVIAHLDCDSFYASVELQRRPELRGQPVVVAGSGPRAVVTTASYEARRFGVHSAMSAVRARRLCPQAIFLPPDFKAYSAKSKEVWDIVRERLGCPMQNVSVDEAYADVTAIEKPLRALRELVAEVRERTGITISVGVGPSRLVAKTASDAEKPAGFVVLSREQACVRFAGEPTRLLQGVGPRTQERLAEVGLHTVADLQAADTDALVARFGERTGRWLKACAFFHDTSPVQARAAAKSLSSETTFDEDVDDLAALEETIRRLAADVCGGLQRRGMRGRTIGDQGPPRRLDQRHPRAHDRHVDQRPGRRSPRSRSSCCAPTRRRGRCGCSGCAWRPSRTRSPPGRPRRWLSSRWRCERPRQLLGGASAPGRRGAGCTRRPPGRRADAVCDRGVGFGGRLPRARACRRRPAASGAASLSVGGVGDAAVEPVAQLVGVVFGVVAALAGDDHAGGGRHAGDACEADNLPGHLHGCVSYRP